MKSYSGNIIYVPLLFKSILLFLYFLIYEIYDQNTFPLFSSQVLE